MALAALALLTLTGFFLFPGHTYLQSDTLIYVPMFDKLLDPSLFRAEILTHKQHVTFTVYDELAIFLHRITTLDFEHVLGGIQLLLRFAGLLGFFLIATSLGLSEPEAILAAGLAGLGAFVNGPAVITIELEPVPRGFAAHLVYLALGLLFHGRYRYASHALAAATMFHFPAAVPALMLAIPVAVRARQSRSLLPIAAGIVLVAILAVLQTGNRESQPVFATVDPQWEALQRTRASYNWVSAWRPGYVRDFFVLAAIALAATARLWRSRMLGDHRLVIPGLVALGLASIGFAAVSLEQWRWLLMAQVQPARAALFIDVFAVLLPAVCAVVAAKQNRWIECAAWSFVSVLLPVHRVVSDWPYPQHHIVTIVALAALIGIASWFTRSTQTAVAILASTGCAAAGAWLIPNYAKGALYAPLHHAELDDVAAWAGKNTPESALFQFSGFGTRQEPSVFRVRARRALYWDHKSGGQVNYSRDFSIEWAKRKADLASGEPDDNGWRARGVDYLITDVRKPRPGLTPVYKNARYAVYRLAVP